MPHLGEQTNQETTSSPTNSSTLGFVNAPYSPDELAQLLRDFRTNGYCILPDVFTIPTVAPFRRRVLAAATAASPTQQNAGSVRLQLPSSAPELIEPIRAPRIRSMLAAALTPEISPSRPTDVYPKPQATAVERTADLHHHPAGSNFHRPFVQVFETSFVINDSHAAENWHRDRYNEGEERGELSGFAASGAGDDIYHHPASVHLAMYFQDMEETLAPTQIVPGSHRDMSLYPTTVVAAKGHQQASQCPIKSFVIRAQDCVVWDQRCWHRRAPFSPRFAGDMRLLAIYGFNTIQQYPHWPATEMEMPLALAHAWANAESPEDAAYWGGKWTARSILAALVQLPPGKLERIKAELAQLTTPD